MLPSSIAHLPKSPSPSYCPSNLAFSPVKSHCVATLPLGAAPPALRVTAPPPSRALSKGTEFRAENSARALLSSPSPLCKLPSGARVDSGELQPPFGAGCAPRLLLFGGVWWERSKGKMVATRRGVVKAHLAFLESPHGHRPSILQRFQPQDAHPAELKSPRLDIPDLEDLCTICVFIIGLNPFASSPKDAIVQQDAKTWNSPHRCLLWGCRGSKEPPRAKPPLNFKGFQPRSLPLSSLSLCKCSDDNLAKERCEIQGCFAPLPSGFATREGEGGRRCRADPEAQLP